MRFSIITTCKGRLDHLKKTFPCMIFQRGVTDFEVIIVDYGDPDQCWRWILEESKRSDFHQLKIVRVLDKTDLWNPGRARNIGFRHSIGRYILFIDADIIMGFRVLERIEKLMKPEVGILRRDIFNRDNSGLVGTFVIRRNLFERVRGYNELGIGWCCEDVDLYQRLDKISKFLPIPNNIELTEIHHESHLRRKYSIIQDLNQSKNHYLGKIFRDSKHCVNPKGFGLGKVKVLSL